MSILIPAFIAGALMICALDRMARRQWKLATIDILLGGVNLFIAISNI